MTKHLIPGFLNCINQSEFLFYEFINFLHITENILVPILRLNYMRPFGYVQRKNVGVINIKFFVRLRIYVGYKNTLHHHRIN